MCVRLFTTRSFTHTAHLVRIACYLSRAMPDSKTQLPVSELKFVDDTNKCLLAVLPRPGCFFSIIGSYCVIRELIAVELAKTNKRGKAIPRVILSLSACDLIFSLALFLTTWPSPSYVELCYNVGTQASCTFQGFFVQFGLTSTFLWSGCLSVFYLLIIRYSWTDTQLEKLEKWAHGAIWVFVIGASVFPIPLGLYNNTGGFCWIESYPYGCKDSLTYGKDANCTRGDNAWVYQVFFQLFPEWTCFFLLLVIRVMIYFSVRKLENTSRKYSAIALTNHTQSNVAIQSQSVTQAQAREAEKIRVNRKKSKAVATQAASYIAALLVPWTLSFAVFVQTIVAGKPNNMLSYFAYTVLPFQGFLNFLVFVRPRSKEMKTPEARFLRWCMFECVSRYCCWFPTVMFRADQSSVIESGVPFSTAVSERQTQTSQTPGPAAATTGLSNYEQSNVYLNDEEEVDEQEHSSYEAHHDSMAPNEDEKQEEMPIYSVRPVHSREEEWTESSISRCAI